MEGSDAKAIETLSHPDPGMLVYYRRQVIAAGRGGPEALAAEDIYALAEKVDRELPGARSFVANHRRWDLLIPVRIQVPRFGLESGRVLLRPRDRVMPPLHGLLLLRRVQSKLAEGIRTD
jgi:hypothetical protein